jgi:hypothetical protein
MTPRGSGATNASIEAGRRRIDSVAERQMVLVFPRQEIR